MQKTVQYIKMKIITSKNPFSLSEMFFATGGLKDGITANGFCCMKVAKMYLTA
jgi:hypothetical protein